LVTQTIGRNFTSHVKIKNMNIELNQAELNELIYALGFTQMNGRLINKSVADKLDSKLYEALVKENMRLEQQLEQDQIRHDMNFKRAYASQGDY
jgi:hypothetical protein